MFPPCSMPRRPNGSQAPDHTAHNARGRPMKPYSAAGSFRENAGKGNATPRARQSPGTAITRFIVDAFSPISGLPEIGAHDSAQVGQGRLGAANRKSTSPENALIPQRAAVLARVGAADQHAALGVDANRL